MLEILLETIVPVLRGERLGCRVRIKPSWSGRVYGTYGINGRFLLFAALLVVSSGALLGRLLALNLERSDPDGERRALLRSSAHGYAWRAVRRPAELDTIQRQTEEMYSRAHQLDTMLGINHGGLGDAGLARVEDAEVARTALPARLPIERATGDVVRLESRFQVLAQVLESREAEFRFLPTIVPIYQAEFVPTSRFGRRVSPFTGLPEMHRGQDLAADMYTKLVATADGVVVAAETDPSKSRMGRYVVIDHDGRCQTYYGHCERLFVTVGERVQRHQVIAEVGNTGRSTGPHVHYEVRIAGEPRDPRPFMVFDPHFSSEEQLRFE